MEKRYPGEEGQHYIRVRLYEENVDPPLVALCLARVNRARTCSDCLTLTSTCS